MLLSAPALNGGTVEIPNSARTFMAGGASLFAGSRVIPLVEDEPATVVLRTGGVLSASRVRGFDFIFLSVE